MANFSESDTKAKFITPALIDAGWNENQIRREKSFTKGRIIVKGKMVKRGEKKFADYILYYKPHIPIALIEAKSSDKSVSDGLQQALEYAEQLDIPFVYSSNGKSFLEHDRTHSKKLEKELSNDEFPAPGDLYNRYIATKEYSQEQKEIISESYFSDGSKMEPRYYQIAAINRAVEAVAEGRKRLLLVMATGTGKTFSAFQIIWRLWKSRTKKRILFLVDRTALADQTFNSVFSNFGSALTRVEGGVDPAYEVYIALYQGLMAGEPGSEKYRDFSKDFFDLVVVDECHRGSASENSVWRQILKYFDEATQIGLTATPKETSDRSNSEYFGDPIYTYSLKQGIEDGFLAPYKVIRYRFNHDEWRPPEGFTDVEGNIIPDEVYNESMFDRSIILEDRNMAVAKCVADYLRQTDVYQKTIVFCVDIAHAERMRQFLTNELAEEAAKDRRYVMRITGDNEIGRLEIENFINPESKYPVIATTSKLLSTGVDTQTVKLIVLDAPMNSISEFKQTIGRGTRVNEEYGKFYFTIMDFRNVTRLFADSAFDGFPEKVYIADGNEPVDLDEEDTQDEVSREDERGENEYSPLEEVISDGEDGELRSRKIVVGENRVVFFPAQRQIQYINPETGKLITTSLTDYTKYRVTSDYSELNDFLIHWNETERKDVIVEELESKGIILEELKEEIGEEYDVFDLILHTAYGRKPLTRTERAKRLRNSTIFDKYEGKAREVIDLLIDKYAEVGITAIDDIGDLQVSPFSEYGTVPEIVNDIFGGRDKYLEVVMEIQSNLYQD
ncbi:MAG: DEAD/DEAH box helicase family protein [Candidatus Paceibacterota bacterium]